MAEKKNFIIENYNGTDYDTLYPETNSGQVLLDTEAQVSTNLESGATLDDALKNISQSSAAFQVGDTLTTARTNLDDKWALCNNEFLAFSEYPELKGLLPKLNFDFLKIGDVTGQYASTIIYNIASNRNAESEQFLITGDNVHYWGNDLTNSDNWEALTLHIGGTSGVHMASYINNMWFVWGDGIYTQYYSGDLASANYIDAQGNPATHFENINGNILRGNDFIYANGKYYHLTYNNFYIYTDITSAPVALGNLGSGKMLGVIPEGVTVGSISSTADNPTVAIIRPNDTVISKVIKGPSGGRLDVSYLTYYEGKYYAFATTYIYSTTSYLFTSDSLDGNFNSVAYEDGSELSTTWHFKDNKHPIETEEGLVFPLGFYIDKSGVVHKWDNYVGNTEMKFNSNLVTGAKNYYFSVYDNKNTLTTIYKQSIASVTKLPSVSIADNLYTYIKVKSKNSCILTVNVTPDDAKIEVKDADGNIVSPNEGSTKVFTLTNIMGEYTVTVSKDGYVSQTVTITNAKNQEVNITLQQE